LQRRGDRVAEGA